MDSEQVGGQPTANNGPRRTQAERTAETRDALLDAAIRLLHRNGYSGTSTDLIAKEAGVSRGALRHHFPTRALLMADIVSIVYEQEHEAYREMAAGSDRGSKPSDWPDMLWEVLSRPSGLAVLEILQASRSDRDLAELVTQRQKRIEELSLATMQERFGPDVGTETIEAVRFYVWAIRGLSIAQVIVSDPAEMRRSVDYFRRLVEAAQASGRMDNQLLPLTVRHEA